jgi:hypothetical protein
MYAPSLRCHRRRAAFPAGRSTAAVALAAVLWATAAPAADDIAVTANIAQAHVGQPATVAVATVPGVGQVSVDAERNGTALTLHARGPQQLLGEAHTVVGVGVSALYIRTPGGLGRLLVQWPGEDDGQRVGQAEERSRTKGQR